MSFYSIAGDASGLLLLIHMLGYWTSSGATMAG